jgi:hypothetical protein
MSNENSFRKVGAGTTFLSPTDFLVQVDTTAGSVTLILPKIATILDSYTTIYQYMGIRIVDASNNASVNNITIAGFETNQINGEGNFVISNNGGGGILTLIGENQWALQQNTSSVGAVEYKQATLPNPSISPFSKPNSEIVGDVFDLGTFAVFGSPFIRLNNGNIANVQYCQSVLIDGTMIYEAYDLTITEGNSGYWVAFKQNEQNPELLEKVGEVQMTSQFWDNWYDWTLKDSGDNVVKFITASYPNSDNDLLESFTTTLTYSNGVLTAVDSSFNFGGNTTLSLFNSLSGLPPILGGSWENCTPEYILDDDYYGMGVGDDYGWIYYRNTSSEFVNGLWDCAGYNIVTGETRFVKPVTIGLVTTTNFDWASWLSGDEQKAIGGFRSHPKGLTFSMCNSYLVDNGNNNNGVLALWSPLWVNNTEVIYMNTRNLISGAYIYTGSGFLFANFPTSLYWDSNNFYTIIANVDAFQGYNLTTSRFNIDSKEVTSWNFPSFETLQQAFVWANNNSLLYNIVVGKFFIQYAGIFDYYVFSNEEPLRLQSNNYYPTNMIGDKSYSMSSGMIYNTISVGCEIDQWKGAKF